MLDFSDSIYDYARDICNKFDQIGFECLAKCGYEKDYILEHRQEFSMRRGPVFQPLGRFSSGTDSTFFHLDKELFTIHEIIQNSYDGETLSSFMTVSFAVTWPKDSINSQELQGL